MADRNYNLGGSNPDRSNQDIHPDRDRDQSDMGDEREQGGSGYSGGSRDVGTDSDRSSSDISGDEQSSEGQTDRSQNDINRSNR